MLPPEKAGKLVVPKEISEDFALARDYMEGAGRAAIAMGACLVLAGAELIRLKKEYGVKAGRPGNSATHCGISWEALVEAEMGFSESKARYCMAMAEEAKRRVPLLQEHDLLNKPLMSLSTETRDQMLKAVQKITENSTVTKLMQDWGITKKSSSGKGGGSGRTLGSHKTETLEEMAQTQVWPVQEAVGLLLETSNHEALLLSLPLESDFESGLKAGLHPLRDSLEKLLKNVEAALKSKGRGKRAVMDPLDQ